MLQDIAVIEELISQSIFLDLQTKLLSYLSINLMYICMTLVGVRAREDVY